MPQSNNTDSSVLMPNLSDLSFNLNLDTQNRFKNLLSSSKLPEFQLPEYKLPAYNNFKPEFDFKEGKVLNGMNPYDAQFSTDSDIAEAGKAAVAARQQQDLLLNSDFFTPIQTPYDQASKYLTKEYGFNPTRNNEDYYHTLEWDSKGIINKGVSGAATFLGRTLTGAILKFGQGFGYLGAMIGNIGQDHYWENVADNGFVKMFENAEQHVKDQWLPVYKSLNYDNKGFFSKLGDATFWNDSMADGAAFMLSAMIPSMGLGALGKLGQLGKLGKIGSLMSLEASGMAGNVIEFATGAKNMFGVASFAVNTASEAAFEATEAYKTNKAQLLQEGKSEEEATRLAGEAASYVFKMNVIVLSASNAFENKIFQKINTKLYGANPNKQTEEALVKGINDDLSVSSKYYNTKLGKFLGENTWGKRLMTYGIKGAGKSTVMEALWEENAQNAAQRLANGYYEAKTPGEGSKKVKAKGSFIEQLLYQTKEALAGRDADNAESIGTGAIIGIVGSTVGILSERKERKEKEKSLILRLNELNESRDNLFGDVFSRDNKGKIIYENGKPKIDENKASIKAASVQEITSQLNIVDEIKSSPELQKIITQTSFGKLVKAHIMNNSYDAFINKLQNWSQVKTEDELNAMGFSQELKNNPQEFIKLASNLKIFHDALSRTPWNNNKDLKSEDFIAAKKLAVSRLYDLHASNLIINEALSSKDLSLSENETNAKLGALIQSLEDLHKDNIVQDEKVKAEESKRIEAEINKFSPFDIDKYLNIAKKRNELNKAIISNKAIITAITNPKDGLDKITNDINSLDEEVKKTFPKSAKIQKTSDGKYVITNTEGEEIKASTPKEAKEELNKVNNKALDDLNLDDKVKNAISFDKNLNPVVDVAGLSQEEQDAAIAAKFELEKKAKETATENKEQYATLEDMYKAFDNSEQAPEEPKLSIEEKETNPAILKLIEDRDQELENLMISEKGVTATDEELNHEFKIINDKYDKLIKEERDSSKKEEVKPKEQSLNEKIAELNKQRDAEIKSLKGIKKYSKNKVTYSFDTFNGINHFNYKGTVTAEGVKEGFTTDEEVKNEINKKYDEKIKALEQKADIERRSQEELDNVKPVYHHTRVKPEEFNFSSFQRGSQSISQFGDGLNASSNTTSFLVNRYGKPIEGEVNDKEFVEIDANKTEKEIYEYLKAKGYKFSRPASEYTSNEKANYQPAIIELFRDFQKSNPSVKGVKISNHIIGGQKVAPFYVIYDSKSFYGSNSLKNQINAKRKAELNALNNQTASEQQGQAEQQKADVSIGKIPNTEYEVKADGVYYQGKKLDNSENKTYRQLIEADIERRRQEEFEQLVSEIFPNTKIKQILYRATKKGLNRFEPSEETRGIYASSSQKEVDQYLARDRNNSQIYPVVMNLKNPKQYKKRYSSTDTRHTNLDEAIEQGYDGLVVTGRDGELNEEVAVVHSNQVHILNEEQLRRISYINAKYDAELAALQPTTISDKKADIERRRQEELIWENKSIGGWSSISNKTEAYIINENGKYLNVSTNKGSGTFSTNKTADTKLTETNNVDGKFENKLDSWSKRFKGLRLEIVTRWEEALEIRNNEINAKYDAELAALEETSGVSGSALKDVEGKKPDTERRRQELESSREIETLYDLRNPIAEDSKEIISKIEEANKLRKEAKVKSEQAAKETNEEKRIALNSDAGSLNEKAQILDKEVKVSRDSVINNTPIKQAITSAKILGQKLLNKIKLAAKSNEWVSSMPISKEEFTKFEDAIKRLSVKNMGEVTSNSEVIPDILLIEEINAKYDAELKALEQQSTTKTPSISKEEHIERISNTLYHQGAKSEFDNRDINYFTESKEEAGNYGSNVRSLHIVPTNPYIFYEERNKDNNLEEEFNKDNPRFDILDNSSEGLQNQEKFFKFIKSKGYDLVDLYVPGSDESLYVVSLDNNILQEEVLEELITNEEPLILNEDISEDYIDEEIPQENPSTYNDVESNSEPDADGKLPRIKYETVYTTTGQTVKKREDDPFKDEIKEITKGERTIIAKVLSDNKYDRTIDEIIQDMNDPTSLISIMLNNKQAELVIMKDNKEWFKERGIPLKDKDKDGNLVDVQEGAVIGLRGTFGSKKLITLSDLGKGKTNIPVIFTLNLTRFKSHMSESATVYEEKYGENPTARYNTEQAKLEAIRDEVINNNAEYPIQLERSTSGLYEIAKHKNRYYPYNIKQFLGDFTISIDYDTSKETLGYVYVALDSNPNFKFAASKSKLDDVTLPNGEKAIDYIVNKINVPFKDNNNITKVVESIKSLVYLPDHLISEYNGQIIVVLKDDVSKELTQDELRKLLLTKRIRVDNNKIKGKGQLILFDSEVNPTKQDYLPFIKEQLETSILPVIDNGELMIKGFNSYFDFSFKEIQNKPSEATKKEDKSLKEQEQDAMAALMNTVKQDVNKKNFNVNPVNPKDNLSKDIKC